VSRLVSTICAAALAASLLPVDAIAATHQFTVSNGAGSAAITSVQISPPSDPDWGPNLLSSGENVAAGATRTFTLTGACTQDVRVIFADHETQEYEGDTSYDTCVNHLLAVSSAPVSGPKHTFTIVNDGPAPVTVVEISPPSADMWGESWLPASATIAAGQSFAVTIDRGCAQDVRVTYGENTRREYRSQDTCQQATLHVSPPAPPVQHAFVLDNETTVAIAHVQISPSTDDAWGSDWLQPSETIKPGATRTFQVQGGCEEDVQVTFADHHQRSWRNFDICQQGRLQIDSESIVVQ
jgi:hypothetical protein